MQKVEIFKKSEKNLVTSKMEQNQSSCSIGILNYHLAPSKSESRIFLWPYGSPLCKESLRTITHLCPVSYLHYLFSILIRKGNFSLVKLGVKMSNYRGMEGEKKRCVSSTLSCLPFKILTIQPFYSRMIF